MYAMDENSSYPFQMVFEHGGAFQMTAFKYLLLPLPQLKCFSEDDAIADFPW